MSNEERWIRWLPLLAAVLCLVLALIGLGDRPLELDEAYSVTSTNQLWRSLQERSASMALYYILLTPWASLSIDPFWIRLPSALFAAAAVGVTVGFALRFFGRQVGIWTTLVILPIWGVTRFAQEARSYSMVMLLAVGSWWIFLRLVERDTVAGWIGWGALGAAVIYSQPLGGLIIAAQMLAAWLEHPQPQVMMRRSAPGLIALSVLLLPMLATFGQGTGAAPDWIEPLGVHSFASMVGVLAGPDGVLQIALALVLVASTVRVATMVSRSVSPTPQRAWHLRCLLLWLWITPAGLVLISLAEPMVRARYLIGVLPAAAIVVALAITSIPAPTHRFAAGLAAVAMLVPGHLAVQLYDGYPWKRAVTLIEEDLEPTTNHGVLFMATGSRHPFELAAAGSGVLQETLPIRPVEPWGTNLRYFEDHGMETIAERSEMVDVMWLVEQRVPLGRGQPRPAHWDDEEPLDHVGFCIDEIHQLHPELSVTRLTPCTR
ncbi:MAG: hypothetical protein ACLFRV_14640 [Acidimicrobiales bacterium]